jgi:DNA repair protein RadA/Sms
MPRPGDLAPIVDEYLATATMPWLNKALGQGFTRGGTFLLAGDPGYGKTTLVMQALADLADRGVKTLYVATEQSLPIVERTLTRVCGRNGRLPSAIHRNFFMNDTLDGLAALPDLLAAKVLDPDGECAGVQIIALDSVQGRGESASATRDYQALYRFLRMCKDRQLVTILTTQSTKDSPIAGPKRIQHNVDVILAIRKTYRLRQLSIPKNRFGQELLDPVVLQFNEGGRLDMCPQTAPHCAVALGYSGRGCDLAQVQASITLPKFGCSPETNHPDMPREKIRQLINVLSGLDEVDFDGLCFDIGLYIPGKCRYRVELDLAVVVSLLASYFRQPLPPRTLFVGEVDLLGRVLPPPPNYMEQLTTTLSNAGQGHVERVYMSQDAVLKYGPDSCFCGCRIDEEAEVRGVVDLKDMIRSLWSSLFG